MVSPASAIIGMPAFSAFDQAGHQVGGAGPERAVADPGAVGDARIGVGGKGAAALVVDQEVPHAELRQRVVERQQLKPAHAEHRPDAGEPQHLGERAAAVHAAGGPVAEAVGVGHGRLSRSAAARRAIATNSRAVMPGAMPSAAARVLIAAQDAVLIGRTRVADARARRRDRAGGDAARVERRQPGDAGLVDADPGIVEQCGERIVFERGFRPAAQEAAMRAGHDDRAGMLGADQRRRVERPYRRRLGDQEKRAFSLGRRLASARRRLAAVGPRRRGRRCRDGSRAPAPPHSRG